MRESLRIDGYLIARPKHHDESPPQDVRSAAAGDLRGRATRLCDVDAPIEHIIPAITAVAFKIFNIDICY
jgi:hypothetical protein